MIKPYSLDIFEDQLYWVAKENGEVWKQDKFGKGEKEKMLVVNPWLTQVRIFHQLRYNKSGNHQLWHYDALNYLESLFWNNGYITGKYISLKYPDFSVYVCVYVCVIFNDFDQIKIKLEAEWHYRSHQQIASGSISASVVWSEGCDLPATESNQHLAPAKCELGSQVTKLVLWTPGIRPIPVSLRYVGLSWKLSVTDISSSLVLMSLGLPSFHLAACVQ